MICLHQAIAQQTIVFKGENEVIGKQVSILEDSTGRMDLKSVRNSSKFVQSQTQVPNMQLSTSVFWLRFTIKNESDAKQLLLSLEYPTLEVCEFYYPLKNGFGITALSDRNRFDQRKYKHQDFIFDIHIPKDSTATFYLKVRSNEQMVLPLVLGTPQHIAETKLTRDLLWGLLVGVLLVMIFYNTFVFISTKDISYLYYVLYAFFIALTQTSLSGYTYRFLFPNSPTLFNMGIIVFNALGGISFALFAQSFLGIKEKMPRMAKVFIFIALLYAATIVVRLMGYSLISYRMTDVSALVVTVSIYIVIIRLSFKGYRPAKFFLLAWTMFFTGVVLFVMRNLGVLPYNSYTNYTMPIGAAMEVILLSLALADRINILKAEKEKTQAEVLRVVQHNEQIVREQNVVLELKVTERTTALSKANLELNSTLKDLKQTQAQLVEAEKMASLGQLTAGIAHEINNPINFVTSNVNPLKRDIDMMMDALITIESVGLSDLTSAEKEKKIKAYKEELDLDYLTEEIKHLINGINEGAQRTAEIVKGLRFFSRLDEDDFKSADINEGLDSTIFLAKHLLHNKIKIVKVYGDLPNAECYPGKLNQAFLNIISNAIYAIQKRFGDQDGGEITITTTLDNDYIRIAIKDNGVGMDAATQQKVFEPFFTTKEVGEGTGLGMSIVYNIIKKHNGKISVSSTIGEGTEFILEIPIFSGPVPINQ
ncbi:7TM diverse intracellular signaling domain-containing protein [Mucilaginibacter gynuensis]|uniref:histidine kinase n=2 Tax=Mucilaginibacter gynuensis TaxID=1302236 RepID=A0ABP8FZF4_9SPHI